MRSRYRHDIEAFDDERFDDMLDARDVEGAGLCWPLTWLAAADEEIKDKWNKFMNGQTFCDAGFYERDVRRFLFGVYPEETADDLTEQPETD